MNCPRCKTAIGPLTSPDAIVTCPGCGSRLMTRSAALRSGATPGLASPVPAAQLTRPGLAPPRIGSGSDSGENAGSRTAVKIGQTTMSGKAGSGSKAGRKSSAADAATLDLLLKEIQALRETQQQILEALDALRGQPTAPSPSSAEVDTGVAGQPLSAIRAPQRKSAVLVDDDAETRQAALAELERGDIPVRAFSDGNKALSAIAQDKPDVIVLEIGVKGDLAGKDLVNMIKATMEWVDIPIILWTRENVSNQREARQVHGADEVVAKSQGAAALVARVITLFRR
jgi:CheY-like chemotaxis protein